MQYITLPHTDLRVSRVCLGTQQLSGSADDETVGRDFTWGAVDQDTATKTVGAAIDAGINFMDCAEAYNNNQAERALGVALRTLGRRHDVVLASKFGKHPALWETDDPTGGATVYTPAMIEEALHKSLASLQTEVIDLYQVHWPGNIGLKGGPDDWKVAANCVDALEKAKAAGLIRHWGVCNFGTEDLLALDKAGGGGAVTNQLPYNLLWRAIEHGILPACEARGMTVLAYSPLQQGLLSGKYTDPTQLEPGRLRTRIFRADRAPQSRHGGPGCEEEVFGDDGLLQKLKQHSETAGASSPEQSKRNATVVPVSDKVLQKCTEESEPLKRLLYDRSNIVDQYASATRIHGNEAPCGPRL